MNYIIYTLKNIRNVLIKQKSIYKKNQEKIRCLKTRNPKEFWKIIKEESSIHSQDTSSVVFSDFIEH